MRQPDRIIRMDTVRNRTGLSRSTIYRKIAEGTFPAQLKISINCAGWRNPTSTDGSPIPWRGDREAARPRWPLIAPCPAPAASAPTASEQLEALLGYRVAMGRPPKHDLSTWTVTDDWPRPVPVTQADIGVRAMVRRSVR